MLSLEECTEIIIHLTKDSSLTTIVLDALGECDEEKRSDLLEALAVILQRSTNLVKIFISSRDDHDIVCQLINYPSLKVQADKNHQDMVHFVHSEVANLMRARKANFGTISAALKQRVMQVLCDGAQGMSVQIVFCTVAILSSFIPVNFTCLCHGL